jgi:eukaryotic translation initiation factor 2C
LTNNNSYTVGRATKAVGVASPAYYADLACERGRCYLHELMRSNRGGLAGERVGEKAVECWEGGPTGDVMRDIMFYL